MHLLHSLGLALGDGTGSGSASGGEGGAYSKGVLVTIDDAIQTLTVVSPSKGEGPEGGGKIAENGSGGKGSLGIGGQGKPVVVHGWSSHHSPLLFAVVSECVWVDPPTAFVATGAGDKDVDGWLDGSVTTMIKNPEEVRANANYTTLSVHPFNASYQCILSTCPCTPSINQIPRYIQSIHPLTATSQPPSPLSLALRCTTVLQWWYAASVPSYSKYSPHRKQVRTWPLTNQPTNQPTNHKEQPLPSYHQRTLSTHLCVQLLIPPY